MTLSGKTAIITGSNSGIGLGVAREMAKAGADVVLNSYSDRDEDHALAAAIAKEFNVKATYVAADMSVAEDCRRLVTASGGCDILINNAGIQHVAPVEEFPVPGMRERGWGRIINIASAHGLTASPYKSAYVAAKHGVVGMTKAVALETAQVPITCNAICPGYVLTPLVEEQIPDTMKEYGMDRETVVKEVLLERQPSKEFATVEQMGGTAVFLASDAAAQITGTTISVDGGWTAL